MFGVGFWELLLIIVVAIVVIPPDKWPAVANQAGTTWIKLKNTLQAFKKEFL